MTRKIVGVTVTIEDVRKRFQETEELHSFLPMLDEYIFSQPRIDWICTVELRALLRYCSETDE